MTHKSPLALAHIICPPRRVDGGVSSALDPILGQPARLKRSRNRRLSFLHGDAEIHPFPPGGFDAAFSRFDVMFFSDPVAAFANVRRALRPGGRLAFVCWRSLSENELDAVPIRAAAPYLPARLVAEAETAGHFSFADPAYVREVLTRSGYDAIDIQEHSEQVRSGSLQAMVDILSQVGSLGAILRDHPKYRSGAVSALAKALLPPWMAREDRPYGPQP